MSISFILLLVSILIIGIVFACIGLKEEKVIIKQDEELKELFKSFKEMNEQAEKLKKNESISYYANLRKGVR